MSKGSEAERPWKPGAGMHLDSSLADLEEVIYEQQRVNGYLKVTAVDPRTYLEVSVFGPVTAGGAALRHLALRKLRQQLLVRGSLPFNSGRRG